MLPINVSMLDDLDSSSYSIHLITALKISFSGTPPQFPEIVDLQSFNVFKGILKEVWGSSELGEIVPNERVHGCDKITAAVADRIRIGIHDD